MLETLSKKSDTSRAILYALNRWQALTRYCDDGRLEIDNLPVERALRGVATGHRAWLFADTTGGAKASANLYSLVETCKANGVDAYRYLTEMFKALPHARSADDYEALLPWKLGQRNGNTTA